MQGFASQSKFAREHGAAKRGGNSPQKSGGSYEEVSAQSMRRGSIGFKWIQDSCTESDDGAGSRNWSSRTGSKPMITSLFSPENTTSVGV